MSERSERSERTMTAVVGTDAPMRTTVQRVSDALGWTAGQVWTVAIGLVVAVPAAVFGLGPALDDIDGGLPLAAPPAVPSAAPAAAVAVPDPPAILGGAEPSTTPALTSRGATAPTGDAPAAAAVPALATSPLAASGRFATIAGAGTVRAVAVAADAVVVTVDAGADAPGRVVVLGLDGEVVLDEALEIDSVAYRSPAGVAVSDRGVFIATADPPAVVRLDASSGAVSKVADIPDVALCLPLAPGPDCQTAVPDRGPRPEHVAVGDDGTLYIADRGQACVLRVPEGDERATTWLCDLAFAPSPTAESGGLTGLAVGGGRLVVTVASAIDGIDRVEEIAIVDGGGAGSRRQLAAPSAGSGTSGVAFLPDGRVVVALTARDALLVVAADGSSSSTVPLVGATGPADVDLLSDALVVVHRADGAAGAVSRRPTPS